MSRSNYLFTSESVSEGHPDKICDRVSDEIVDAYLAVDPGSRVACETLVTTNLVVLAGETRCAGEVSPERVEELARAAIKDIGYDRITSTGRIPKFKFICTRSQRTLRRALMRRATKTKVLATKGLCLGTPARKPMP